eukprot:TRINITY_DN4270_c1_g1_i2.p1 TRINITY_DN4270_c1_g1~~TRINITY_DN4270_c1_g1_i2.p1  ORF type:complete len:753 (+),score=216.34 TRINITY_DN4270_c1_g1_i2:223-2481(+)
MNSLKGKNLRISSFKEARLKKENRREIKESPNPSLKEPIENIVSKYYPGVVKAPQKEVILRTVEENENEETDDFPDIDMKILDRSRQISLRKNYVVIPPDPYTVGPLNEGLGEFILSNPQEQKNLVKIFDTWKEFIDASESVYPILSDVNSQETDTTTTTTTATPSESTADKAVSEEGQQQEQQEQQHQQEEVDPTLVSSINDQSELSNSVPRAVSLEEIEKKYGAMIDSILGPNKRERDTFQDGIRSRNMKKYPLHTLPIDATNDTELRNFVKFVHDGVPELIGDHVYQYVVEKNAGQMSTQKPVEQEWMASLSNNYKFSLSKQTTGSTTTTTKQKSEYDVSKWLLHCVPFTATTEDIHEDLKVQFETMKLPYEVISIELFQSVRRNERIQHAFVTLNKNLKMFSEPNTKSLDTYFIPFGIRVANSRCVITSASFYNTLYVKPFKFFNNITEEDVEEFLKSFGLYNFRYVQIPRSKQLKSLGFFFVDFDSHEHAHDALQVLQGSIVKSAENPGKYKYSVSDVCWHLPFSRASPLLKYQKDDVEDVLMSPEYDDHDLVGTITGDGRKKAKKATRISFFETEYKTILSALVDNDFSRELTAKQLGVSPTQLITLMIDLVKMGYHFDIPSDFKYSYFIEPETSTDIQEAVITLASEKQLSAMAAEPQPIKRRVIPEVSTRSEPPAPKIKRVVATGTKLNAVKRSRGLLKVRRKSAKAEVTTDDVEVATVVTSSSSSSSDDNNVVDTNNNTEINL